jgi:hypothetical protein
MLDDNQSYREHKGREGRQTAGEEGLLIRDTLLER